MSSRALTFDQRPSVWSLNFKRPIPTRNGRSAKYRKPIGRPGAFTGMTEIKLKTSVTDAIQRVLLRRGTLPPNYMGWCGKNCKRCANFDCKDIRDFLPDLGFEGALCDEIVAVALPVKSATSQRLTYRRASKDSASG